MPRLINNGGGSGSGNIDGSGASPQLAYFTDVDTIASDSFFTLDIANDEFVVGVSGSGQGFIRLESPIGYARISGSYVGLNVLSSTSSTSLRIGQINAGNDGIAALDAGRDLELYSGEDVIITPNNGAVPFFLFTQESFLTHRNGNFSTEGDAQTRQIILKVETADATPTEIELTDAPTYLTMENNTAYTFVVHIVAKEDGAQSSASYVLKFNFDRGANAASSLVNGFIKEVIHEYNAALDVNVTADTTNGRPKIEVTGLAATDIRWVARVEVTEVK